MQTCGSRSGRLEPAVAAYLETPPPESSRLTRRRFRCCVHGFTQSFRRRWADAAHVLLSLRSAHNPLVVRPSSHSVSHLRVHWAIATSIDC